MDGEISINDVTHIQKICARIILPDNENVKKLADVNGDGMLSIRDATFIQKYLVGGVSNTGNTGKYLTVI